MKYPPCTTKRWQNVDTGVLIINISKLCYKVAWIRIRMDPHSIGTLYPDPDPNWDLGLDPDPHETDVDPKHYLSIRWGREGIIFYN